MSLRDRILDAVKNKLGNRAQEGDSKGGGLFGKITDILTQRTRASSPRANPMSNVRPASEDPYGDPADERLGRNAPSASVGRNVRPASEDPYGDPADEPRRRS
jgi:hypothetical protein